MFGFIVGLILGFIGGFYLAAKLEATLVTDEDLDDVDEFNTYDL